MLTDIRLLSQQLAKPKFKTPQEVVAWMGAIQAQEYTMAKWAVGCRLKSATLQAVDDALARGEILRTHILRPTWHFVAAGDIRWMLQLSGGRIKTAFESYARSNKIEIPESLYIQSNNLLEKLLAGNKSLTKQELGEEFARAGFESGNYPVHLFLIRAEADGLVCSGVDKGKKPTYALLDERVPPVKELHREEALARLATLYFQSHSPATLADFIWWSGLTTTDARHAIGLIECDLFTELYDSEVFYLHTSCDQNARCRQVLHLLPSYDEYLINYKDRTTVMFREHHPKAFNSFGIFYPVILHNGRIIGNWKKSTKKKALVPEVSFFDGISDIPEELLEKATDRYCSFYAKE
ncbi:MAG: winged helix DNA-binding domain-containing protein [Parabacteroides sp.]|nr:winged helix DNA-binding domain-containing protein [Parabacteroides sp.]